MAVIFSEEFESGQWTHDVKIFPIGEPPYETQVGNIFTPKGWLAWFLHDPGTWDQPEGRSCWTQNDPRRIHGGTGAYLLFWFWRHGDGGLMRQAQVEPGTKLHFTAWAHAWSNTSLPGHEACCDDGLCSCGVDRDVVAIPLSGLPEPSGDPWEDAVGNSVFSVGIDPTGGTDPFAATVEWGDAYAIYNGYAQQLGAETVAQNSTVTVFLRHTTKWAFKHNDGYWDDVTLESMEAPPSYESTMLVLPQTATPKQLQEIFTLAYPNRRTFGFSHDDAGHLNGTAVLYNIPDEERFDYLHFYTTYYPAVTVEFAYTSDWEEPPLPPSDLLLWQCNSLWKDEKIAGSGCPLTLCQTGCWVTDCAMAQRFFSIKADATPHTANQALGAAGGFSGCNTLWSAMKTALGLEVFESTTDDAKAQAWLDGGYVCFAEVEPSDYQHFVLVTKCQAGRFWMHDPYKNVEGWLDEYYPGAESWRLVCPFEEALPPIQGSLVSLHLQQMVPGALEFIARIGPSVVKIFQLENARAIKAASPNTKVVLRYYTSDQNLSGDLAERAREYVHSFEDSLRTNAEWIDYVESYNEEIPTNNNDKTKLAVEFDCRFADALMGLGLPVAPVLLCVPVGNPSHTGGEIELMLPAVEKVIQYNGALGYHAYGLAANKSNLNNNWEYYAGRALEGWDPVFRAHGLYPKYIFGECGAFADCSTGWRAAACLGEDWPLYLAQLTEFNNRIKAWNAAHGNRCLGGTIFTSGGFRWDSFLINQSEMESLDWPT